MIEISFAAGMSLTVTAWILFRIAAYIRTKKVNWKFEGVQIFFLINLIVIVRFTFYPFATVNGQVQPLVFNPATAWPFRVNPVPFVNLLDYESRSDLLINIIGNFAMFIPTGIMLPLIYRNQNSLKKVFGTGALISLGIELIQLPFSVRASDVDDLILNTAGCLMGYGIYILFKQLCRKQQH